MLQLERAETFAAQDAAGTHLNAASALAQLRQFEEAISHCRCALAILHNQTDAGKASAPEIEQKGGAHRANDQGRTRGGLGATEGLAPSEPDRTCLAVVRLARLHQAAGNVEAALGAWLR